VEFSGWALLACNLCEISISGASTRESVDSKSCNITENVGIKHRLVMSARPSTGSHATVDGRPRLQDVRKNHVFAQKVQFKENCLTT
jgi:hypothetical protein